jgi:Lon protease-like protein
MLRRALERGEPFATGPDPAVGTTVDIASCKELPDGRYEVVLRGLQRFRTASVAVRPASFGLQLVTPIPFDDLVEPLGADARADAHDIQRARAASAILFTRFTEEGLDVEEEFGPPPPEDDLPALSMWLAAAIPAEPLRKRQWLLLQDARKRLRDQRNWLQQALVAGIL